jgi:hypothetical protein
MIHGREFKKDRFVIQKLGLIRKIVKALTSIIREWEGGLMIICEALLYNTLT